MDMTWKKSRKLDGVGYDIRGIVLEEAKLLEKKGIPILKLNTGNTPLFNLFPTIDLYKNMFDHQEASYGYGDSRGILTARNAIKEYYQKRNIAISIDNIFLGNGVSELIPMSLNSFINTGDEVLIPTPDYPLWTASVRLGGGKAVHYICDEQSEWNPDCKDIESKITSKTKAIVVINPNNPTGAVYDKKILQGIVAIAKKYKLIIFSDEIYDRVLYDGVSMYYMAQLCGDYPCIFFNGLSKAYRAPGLRVGWLVVHDPRNKLKDIMKGLAILSNMRLCSNMLAQWAVPFALQHDSIIDHLVSPQGRLYQQRQIVMDAISTIDGLTAVCPKGAMYVFPKIDTKKFSIIDDEKLVLDILHQKHILLVHGKAFNYKYSDHIRIVILPAPEQLQEAMQLLCDFFLQYKQSS